MFMGAIVVVFIVFTSSLKKSPASDGDFTYAPAVVLSASFGINEDKLTGYKPKCIVIDPGHGGEEYPGCVYDGILERDLNLLIAFRVRDFLEEIGYRVVLTREDNTPISPEDRAAIAENIKADALISIHQNALEDDIVTDGIETWYNEQTNESNMLLAEYIQNETANIAKAKNRGLWLSEKLVILRDVSMPSCLIETGFLSSNTERVLLTSPDYQDNIAQGIVNGIEKFFENNDAP